MKWSLVSWFMPDELIQQVATLLIVVAGFVMMIGARRLAFSLILSSVALLVLPAFSPLIEEILAALPEEAIWVVLLWMGGSLFAAFLGLLFGRRVVDQVIAQLIVAFILFAVLSPFRMLGFFTRVIRLLI